MTRSLHPQTQLKPQIQTITIQYEVQVCAKRGEERRGEGMRFIQGGTLAFIYNRISHLTPTKEKTKERLWNRMQPGE